ncbi:MAG: extracellular solute-binding protein [Nocardioides sp.]
MTAVGITLAGCGSGEQTASPSPSATTSSTAPVTDPAEVTLGVWGDDTQVAAWTQAVDAYNGATDLAHVTLTSWADDASMLTAFADASTAVPDVFLISRGDLAQLETETKVEPVDSYLDARNVDIGDEYSRDALEAFSSDHHLQCMPFGVSPEVVYYNSDLVDFARMKAKGVDVPDIDSSKSWTWDEFQLAAQEAASQDGVKAFSVTPSLAGIAPFVLAAGGTLASEDDTSLTLSDDDTLDALGKVLPVLSNPTLTTTATAAKQLRWFKKGKLAMMVGDRSLVPQLRAQSDATGLRWDVLPIPKIDTAATVGDYTALCLSADSEHIEDAADLLVGMSSETGVVPLAATGEVVPVNQKVALSEDFLQPDLSPLHSSVFVQTVRSMRILPLTHQWEALEAAVTAQVANLFIPGQLPVAIDQLAEQIDETSRGILDAAAGAS